MLNKNYIFNGEPISEDFVIEAAEVEGLSVDEYVNQKDGLETVEVTDEIQTPVTEGKTSDVATVDADVTSEPDTASESTVSESVDTFGESQDPKLRFIDFKINGKESVLYESDYNELAGQPIPSTYGSGYAGKNYPETFEEYAELFKTPIQTINKGVDLESGIKIEPLEEVVVTGKATPKTKKARQIASGVLETQSKITVDDSEDLIVSGIFQPVQSIYNKYEQSINEQGFYVTAIEDVEQRQKRYAEIVEQLEKERDEAIIQEVGQEYFNLFKNNGFTFTDITTDDLHAKDIENQITKLRSQSAENYIRQQIQGTDIDPRAIDIQIGYEQESFTEDIFGQTEVQNVINENRRVIQEYQNDLGYLAARRPLEYDVPVTFNNKTYLVKTPPNLGEIENRAVQKTSKVLEQQSQDILKRQKDQQKKSQPYLDQIEEYDRRIDAMGSPENIFTQASLDLYNNLISKRNKVITKLNTVVPVEDQQKLVNDANAFSSELKQLEENAKNIGSTYIAGSALSKNYSLYDKLMATLESQLVAPTVKIGAEVASGILAFDQELSKNLSETSTDYFQRISDFRQTEFPQDVTKVNGDLNADWTMKLTDMSINNAPTIASVLLPQAGVTLGVGSKLFMKGASKFARQKFMNQQRKKVGKISEALFFNMSAGSQLATQQIAVKDAPEQLNKLKVALDNIQSNPDDYSYLDKKQVLEQIDYYENVLDTEGYKRYLNAAAYGILEVGVERNLGTLRVFRNARQVSNTLKGKKLTNFQKQYRQSLNNLINIPGEVGEEFLVEGGNNLLDNIFLGENKSVFDGMNLELAENSAFSIVAMRGPSNFKNVYNGIKNQLTSSQDKKKTKAKVEELFALEGEIQNNRDNPGTLKPAEIRAKRNRIYEIQNELRIDDFLSIQKWTGMSDSQKKQLIDLGGQLAQAEADLFELAQNPDYGVEGFNEAYKAAEEKVMQLQKQQGELLKTQKYKSFEYLRDEVKVFPPSVVEARSQLYQASRDLASIQNDGKVVSLADSEAVDAFVEDNNLSEEEAEGLRNSNAAVIGGRIIQNESAIRDQILFGSSDIAMTAAISPLHELFHLEAKKQKIFTGKNLSEKLKIAVLGLEDIVDQKVELGSITEATANSIKNRLKQYKDDPSLTEETRLEEVMAVFTESVLLGKIKKSDMPNMYGTKSFLNTAFSTLTGGKFKSIIDPFTTSNDLYEFISNFATKASQVELQVGDIEEDDSTIKASKAVNDLAVQYKNNKESMSEQDISSLQDQYQRLGIDALQRWAKQRGVPLQVDENVISDINNQFESVMKNYTPTNRVTGKPMQLSTYVGNILGRRVGPKIVEDYTRRTGQSTITQAVEQTQFADETAEQAFEIEERSQAEESGRSKLIDVRQSPRVKRVLPTLEKEIKITEGDSSVNILNNNRSKFASEIYNIPEGKIEKVDNLTYSKNKPETSELGRIQQDFSNAQETERSIKTMPEFNVTTMESTITEQGERVPVSPEVRGRSMKIGQTVLDFFYEPYTDPASESTDRAVRAMAITNKSGRSKGKTTQTKVYRLKPEFRPNAQGKISPQAVSKAREWAGIDIDLNELSKNERRNYATKLAAWARMRGGQVALSVADKSLPESATKQQRADTRAGRSRLMFSKQGLLNVTQARDINAVAKILNISKITVNDNNRVEKQKQMEEAIVAAKIPSWMFEGSKFGNFARRKVNGVRVDLPARGGLYYGGKDPAYQRALNLAKQNDVDYDIKPPKRVNIKKAFTKEGQQQGEDNLKALEFFGNKLADAVAKKQMPLEIAALFVASGYQATSGIIKIAAPFKYKSKVFKYGTTPNQSKGEKFREEHNPPASVIGATLIYGIATNSMSDIIPAIKNNYYQTQLSKADDQKIDEANLDKTLPEGTTILDNPIIRLIDSGIDMNSLVNEQTGKTVAEELGVALKSSDINVDTVFEQNKILKEVLSGDITAKTGQDRLNEFAKLKSIPNASISNNNENNIIKFSKEVPNQEVLDNLSNADAAMANARNPKTPVKKIRVFDFDDTLARSNSQVLYEMPDGTTGKLNATQFAERAGELEAEGAEFDFSEFSKVIDGKRGPVFKAIENIIAKRGAEDVFILTARPANAAGPIKEFMDALGVNLPIKNIVGLGDGKAEAKARWMTAKAAEGYNDFFFVDDAYKNVKAVQDALEVFDVKSKTQQAKVKFSKAAGLDKDFNDILEQSTGIASEKEYKRVKAEVAGASRGIAIRGIPYSAQDFVGLLYETLGKGKVGDAQMAWYKTHLFDPYSRAMTDIDNARLNVMADYRALKKQLGLVPKNLRKKIPGEPFTREQAVRVYIWNQQGTSIPGVSQSDLKELTDFVENNAELKVFADQLIAIQKGDEYAKPKEGWPAGSITTDLLEGINTVKRAKYLEQWKENKDIIFSEKNMNKLEAAYGKKYRKALENMLGRMESGRNRNFSDDTLTARFTDWLQGSVGTIMFFNTRSALLQTLSSINFINFTDNNPLAAAKAFANQKQYWSDFMTLINSDFLKARRSGLRMNVNEADIADMAKKGGPKAVIGKLLQLGFAPTQIADSFAIASGGATFYRNRVKTYQKQGMSKAEAEEKAFTDFRENAEESQQSARPDRISMQQAGGLGRLILAFQNTPAQYARLIDKAVRDLKNGRGDAKTNISKILYYSTVQNLLFNALQQAMFAFAFDDEEPEDEEKKEKYLDVANGMMDSLLRGTGLAGGVVSVTKNAIIRIVEESEKDRPKFEKVGADLLKIAPPVSSKLSKINQAARSYQWDKKEMQEKGWSLDNPAYLAAANVIAATTNVPLDRVVKKGNNVANATDSDLETWERLALLGGWQDWEIGIDEEKPTNKPQPRKSKFKSKTKLKKKKL